MSTSRRDQMVGAVIGAKQRLDAALDDIRSLSKAHFNRGEDELTFGTAGSINHAAELIEQALDVILQISGVR